MMMVLFILALLSMPVSAALMGQWWLCGVFSIFYVIFGVIEIIAKTTSGKTVSQHVWTLPMWKRLIIVGCMILGWGALIAHFVGLF